MSSKTTVLVTGATGMAGFEVVRRLMQNPDLEIRAAFHSLEKRSILPSGVTPVAFDNADRAKIDAAMQGVDQLFLLTPGGPAGPAANRLIVEAAQRHGVQRIAKLSSFKPEREPQVPTDVWALQIEAILRDSGIPCTFFQPPWFNQNFTRGHFAPMLARGAVTLPFGEGRCAWVDTRDIAAMIEKALLEDQHAGKSYIPTGPKALNMTEIVTILSEVTGKEITYRAMTKEEWMAMARAHGESEENARAGFSLMNKTAEGHIPDVTRDCERVTGSRARSFAEFASENAELLKSLAYPSG